MTTERFTNIYKYAQGCVQVQDLTVTVQSYSRYSRKYKYVETMQY